MRTPQESEQFLQTMIEIGHRRDPSVIDALLQVLDDNTEDRTMMTELYRVIEKEYAPAVYVPALFRNLGSMLRAASESTFYMHARVLNDDDDTGYKLYLAGTSTLSRDLRDDLLKLLADISARYPDRVAKVRAALATG